MAAYRRTALALSGMVALALLTSACTKPVPETTTPAPTTITTPSPQTGSSTATATTKPVSTEVVTPPSGSPERKALLDAARKKFSTNSEFYVYQLYLQGDSAIGEIAPTSSGKRTFVAWGDGPQWAVVWTATPGSASASAKGVAAAVPSLSAQLIDKMSWSVAGPTAAEIAAKQSSLAAAAKKWSKTTMSGAGQPYKVTLNKVARDTNNAWWGHIVTQPTADANSDFEPLNYWAKYTGGAWKGSLQDPEPPAASTYFPASVIPKLGL